jgi:hypothetical protein
MTPTKKYSAKLKMFKTQACLLAQKIHLRVKLVVESPLQKLMKEWAKYPSKSFLSNPRNLAM